VPGEEPIPLCGGGGVGGPTGRTASEGSAALQGAGRRTRRAACRFLELGLPPSPAEGTAPVPAEAGGGIDGAEQVSTSASWRRARSGGGRSGGRWRARARGERRCARPAAAPEHEGQTLLDARCVDSRLYAHPVLLLFCKWAGPVRHR
jgi:hypothetical protein